MSWIATRWVIVFSIMFVCFYIPITINIGKFIKPIRQAAKYADSLALGDVYVEVEKNRTDEIGVLQESFIRLVHASREQAELMERIAGGDFTVHYEPNSQEDLLGHNIVKMVHRNNDAMIQVLNSSKQISMASSQLASGSHTLSSGTTQQAASVEELSATLNVLSEASMISASKAEAAFDLANNVKSGAERGRAQMNQMMSAVEAINDASQSIAKVIKVIDDIAFQTNILALNAAVEAARAGQHGKGFAVVADEVRNLASKSAEAAKDTERLIADSIEKTNVGTRIANETSQGFNEIISGIAQSSTLMGEIAETSKVQAAGIVQINQGIGQISSVTQQNSATAEQLAASSQEMDAQTKLMEALVSNFKLKSESAAIMM